MASNSESNKLQPLLQTTETAGRETATDHETISDGFTTHARSGSPPRESRSDLGRSSEPPNTNDTDGDVAGIDSERTTTPANDTVSQDEHTDVLEDVVPSLGLGWDPRVKNMILDGRPEDELPRDPNRDW